MASRISNLGTSASAAARRAMRARWGEQRGECARIRVDLAAAERLSLVPECDRRRVATRGVLSAAEAYLREHGRL